MKGQSTCILSYQYDSPTSTYFFAVNPSSNSSLIVWDFGDGISYSAGMIIDHQYAVSGTYAVCATEIDSMTQAVIGNCCASIQYVASSTCNFTYSFPNSNDSTQVLMVTNGSSLGSFWDFGDGNTGTGATALHTFPGSGTYNVCVTNYNLLDTCTICQTISIQNTPPPTCAIYSVMDSSNTMNYYFGALNANPSNNFTWTFGDGNTGTGLYTSHLYSAPGTYTVCEIETDSNGVAICQTCSQIQVTSGFNCGFTAVPSGSPLNTFFFNSTFNAFLYSGTWQIDGVPVANGNSFQYTFNAPGVYLVCLTLYDNSTQNVVCTYCTPITVSFNQTCQANFTTVPYGLDAYFIDYSATDPSITTYMWSFGDGSPISTSRFPVHTYTTPGTYTVCLAIQNSFCSDSLCQTIVVDSTIITPVFCTSYFVFTQLSPYQLAVVNLSSGTNLNFAWDFGDGTTSNAAYPIHNYSTYGSYQICLTVSDGNGCSNTYCDSLSVDSTGMIIYRSTNVGFTINVMSPTQLSTVSVSENTPSLITNIFPNPSKDRIFLTSPANSGVMNYSILSFSSQLLKEGRISGEKSEIDIADLSPGIYFVEVKNSAGERSYIRFIKE